MNIPGRGLSGVRGMFFILMALKQVQGKNPLNYRYILLYVNKSSILKKDEIKTFSDTQLSSKSVLKEIRNGSERSK